MAIFIIGKGVWCCSNVIIEALFGRIEQKHALSGFFIHRNVAFPQRLARVGQALTISLLSSHNYETASS